MLHVRAVVRPSAIEGLGLFAAEPIPAGALVAAWDERFDRAFAAEEIAALPPPEREHLERFGWRGPDGRVRAAMSNSRFINHSPAPNLVCVDGASYAARDIAAGEELTEDYAAFDPDFAAYAAEMGGAAGDPAGGADGDAAGGRCAP
jgi:SET domain-containing protein